MRLMRTSGLKKTGFFDTVIRQMTRTFFAIWCTRRKTPMRNPHYGNQGGDPSSIIRSGPWKLIHYYEDGHDELYNLDSDPGEQNDVLAAGNGNADGRSNGDDRTNAADNDRRAAELRQRLDLWLAETGAKFPTPDPEYDAEKEKARLHDLEHELMPQLEAQHAEYLDADWQPNDDWWGSQVTVD